MTADDGGYLSEPAAARSARQLLILLLFADAVFIGLHTINAWTPYLRSPYFSLEQDLGYAEAFQYVKWGWLTVMLASLSVRRRSLTYAAWALLTTYLLVDDAIEVHERAGRVIGDAFFARGVMEPNAVGEVMVTLLAVIVLGAPVVWCYRRGSLTDRRVTRQLTVLCLVLGCCGVLVDSIHSIFSAGRLLPFVLSVLEDGGEMIVASAMVQYVFHQSLVAETAFPLTASSPGAPAVVQDSLQDPRPTRVRQRARR